MSIVLHFVVRANTRNPRIAVVEENTRKVAEMLKSKGSVVDFQVVPGTHFSPFVPRLELALESFLLHFTDEKTRG